MDISRWALQASSAQLNVVSHNVANVNTDGYSRQEAIQTTRIPEDTPQGYYGRGTALSQRGAKGRQADPGAHQRQDIFTKLHARPG
jgi:flagellar basal body rod protein FlgG